MLITCKQGFIISKAQKCFLMTTNWHTAFWLVCNPSTQIEKLIVKFFFHCDISRSRLNGLFKIFHLTNGESNK